MGKKKKSKTISDLFLDRPTSHGGWPDGHSGGYTDNKTPVNQQLAKFFQDMGLIDDDNPRARISEGIKVKLSKEHIKRYTTLKESNLSGLERAKTLSKEGAFFLNKKSEKLIRLLSSTLRNSHGGAITVQSALSGNSDFNNLSTLIGDLDDIASRVNLTLNNSSFSYYFNKATKPDREGVKQLEEDLINLQDLLTSILPPRQITDQNDSNYLLDQIVRSMFKRKIKSEEATVFDAESDFKDNDNLSALLNAFDAPVNSTSPESNFGSAGESLLIEYLKSIAEIDYGENLNNVFPSIKSPGGIGGSQFPGVDVWLSLETQRPYQLDHYSSENSELNFGDDNVFASVKSSRSGTSSGTQSTQPTTLSEDGQKMSAGMIIITWLSNNKQSFSKVINKQIAYLLSDNRSRLIQATDPRAAVNITTLNPPDFPTSPSNLYDFAIDSLIYLNNFNDPSFNIRSIKINFDAYNISMIPSMHLIDVLTSDLNEKNRQLFLIAKKENRSSFSITIDQTNSTATATAREDLTSQSYPETVGLLLGKDIEYEVDIENVDSDILKKMSDDLFGKRLVSTKKVDVLTPGANPSQIFRTTADDLKRLFKDLYSRSAEPQISTLASEALEKAYSTIFENLTNMPAKADLKSEISKLNASQSIKDSLKKYVDEYDFSGIIVLKIINFFSANTTTSVANIVNFADIESIESDTSAIEAMEDVASAVTSTTAANSTVNKNLPLFYFYFGASATTPTGLYIVGDPSLSVNAQGKTNDLFNLINSSIANENKDMIKNKILRSSTDTTLLNKAINDAKDDIKKRINRQKIKFEHFASIAGYTANATVDLQKNETFSKTGKQITLGHYISHIKDNQESYMNRFSSNNNYFWGGAKIKPADYTVIGNQFTTLIDNKVDTLMKEILDDTGLDTLPGVVFKSGNFVFDLLKKLKVAIQDEIKKAIPANSKLLRFVLADFISLVTLLKIITPKPPGLSNVEVSQLIFEKVSSAVIISQEDYISYLSNRIAGLNNFIFDLLQVLKEKDTNKNDFDNFGNEVSNYQNLNTQNTEIGLELTPESKIYKKVVHRILLESFYRKRGLR